MERDVQWSIDDDPAYSMAAVTLVDGGHVEIINNTDNLQIVINEIGGMGLFKSTDGKIIFPNKRYFGEINTILLPEQEFQLLFIRRKEVPENELGTRRLTDVAS